MSEHVHEYRWSVSVPLICGCGAALLPDDVERIVNATEKLSAKTALAIWRKLDALSREHLGYEFSLFAYAEALEK